MYLFICFCFLTLLLCCTNNQPLRCFSFLNIVCGLWPSKQPWNIAGQMKTVEKWNDIGKSGCLCFGEMMSNVGKLINMYVFVNEYVFLKDYKE